jgi:hypothetical protein
MPPPTFLNATLFTNNLTGNVAVKGAVIIQSNGNAFALSNTSIITGVGASPLPTDIIGNVSGVYANVTTVNATNVNATGNVTASYFIGNGSQLTGIATSTLPERANIDISGNVNGSYANVTTLIGTTGNVGNVRMVGGNIAVSGQVNALGNVVAPFFVGNGSQLTGIEQYILPSEITADVFGNVTATGNVDAAYFLGNGSQLTGIEQYILPSEITADVLGNVIGAYANVTTLLGTTGNVGNVQMTGGNVEVSGQVNALGNVVASFFVGNGSLLTGIEQYVLPGSANIDIAGNVIGSYANVAILIGTTGNVGNVRLTGGNIAVSGQVNALGNVVASFFVGDGSQLTGIAAALPGVISEDIVGNVIGAYANVTALIGTIGNVGNVRMVGGNVEISGQINTLGNVAASYFIGNGSQLIGVTSTLPGSAPIDITGNHIGSFANVATLIGTTGNVGNVRMVGGNVEISGQVNALGNVVAPFFIGNGALLEGIAPPARYLAAVRSTNQTIGSGNWGNVNVIMNSVRESAGITYNTSTGVITLEGGVTYRITAQMGWTSGVAYTYGFRLVNSTTGVQIGPDAQTSAPTSTFTNAPGPVLDLILTPSTTTDYRLRMSTFVTAGSAEQIRSDSGTFLNIVGLGSGFSTGLPTTGNIDMRGNIIGAYANVDIVLANSATITSAANANVLTVAGTTINTTGSLIQATSLRGNNSTYSLLRLDNIGGRLLDVNGNGEMSLTSAASGADIMSISTRTGALAGNALSIVVPRLSFTDYSFISCRNTNGTLFNVDGRGMLTSQCAVNGNVVNVVSSSATNTNDMIRIQSSASAAQPFNMISAKNSAGNVFRVTGAGAVFGVGAYNTSGADYAEMFEWEDGNASGEDRRGMTVVKGNNGVIRVTTDLNNPATVFGVVSTNPSIIGDAKWDEWNGRFLRDRFGAKLSNTVYYMANVSNENEIVRCTPSARPRKGYEKIVSREFIENPAYDPNVAYVSREERKEWATIGLVGKLMVLPGQVVNPNWILFRNISHPDGDVLEYIVK